MPDLAVDPQSPEHLYIRLKFERVYESWDGGQNWQARWEGLGAAREVISIDLGSSGLLVAGANDGLFRWASGEGHWQRVAPGLEGQTVFTVVIDPQDETLVYAGATDGLWRSQDGGDSWSRWGDGLAGITVTAVGLDPIDEQVAYAGTMYEGLYVTEDRGVTWRPAWHGVPTTASVRAILLSPDGQQVYVATDQGVFRRRSS
jgi:ligand-binding sensor domain-containing protein